METGRRQKWPSKGCTACSHCCKVSGLHVQGGLPYTEEGLFAYNSNARRTLRGTVWTITVRARMAYFCALDSVTL